MKISLLQRISYFTLGCVVLFGLLVASIIWSSKEIELAFHRDNYAQQLTIKTNKLKQLIDIGDIYAGNFNINNWQSSHLTLTYLLNSAPVLSPKQQTIQLSIQSQNESLRKFFALINQNKLKNAKESIKNHVKARLMTQLEVITSDALQLTAIAKKDIYETIKTQVFYIVVVAAVSILALMFGAFSLTHIVRKSLVEVKEAFDKNESGDFQRIHLSHHSPEFDDIVEAFNLMNEKLNESTVSLSVMQKIIDERTHFLEELSNTDPLTKVANRRALFERANLEFSRAIRGDTKLTLLLLDCDFFKKVNDDYGHLFGDKVLIHITKVCAEEIRDVDFLARYGGEEFIIILPDCDLVGGVETATRIQRSLAKKTLSINEKEVSITLSIGACMLNEYHKSLEELINDTDKAMYLAKENGRNRIEVNTKNNLH